MKSDSERKRFYCAKNHERTRRMRVHLSKELRSRLKQKKRSLLLRKGDVVSVMRGPGKGKNAKVIRSSHSKMRVFVEGVNVRTSKGREVLVPLQPSNLMLVELEKTKERAQLFSDEAFRKAEKKPEKKESKVAVKLEKPEIIEAEVVPEEKKEEKTADARPETARIDKKLGAKAEMAKVGKGPQAHNALR